MEYTPEIYDKNITIEVEKKYIVLSDDYGERFKGFIPPLGLHMHLGCINPKCHEVDVILMNDYLDLIKKPEIFAVILSCYDTCFVDDLLEFEQAFILIPLDFRLTKKAEKEFAKNTSRIIRTNYISVYGDTLCDEEFYKNMYKCLEDDWCAYEELYNVIVLNYD